MYVYRMMVLYMYVYIYAYGLQQQRLGKRCRTFSSPKAILEMALCDEKVQHLMSTFMLNLFVTQGNLKDCLG